MTASFSSKPSSESLISREGAPLKVAPYPKALRLIAPQGQLQVHTASYRGSFSVVLSEALRSAGLGSQVLIAQFLKGGVKQGPGFGINLCGRLEWIRPAIEGCITVEPLKENKFIFEHNIATAIEEVWQTCKKRLLDNIVDRIVLDEIGLAISMGLIDEGELIYALQHRSTSTDVILTGPCIPFQILEMADQVTQLRCS